jgi:copper oxidase (laccase) domain-containing protein
LAGCTLEDDDYFSYRRNKITGRQAGVIKLWVPAKLK